MKKIKLSIKIKIGLAVFFLIIFFFVLNLTDFSKEVKNFFYLISAPIQNVFWQIGKGISDFFGTIFNIKELKNENKSLKLEIQELNARITQLKEIEKENKILRETLDIGLQKEFKLIFGQIVGKDIGRDSILINKGLKDGVLKNMPVITQQKILIGRIIEIYNDFSRVMLISHQDSAIPVSIENTDAITVGKNNFQAKVDHISSEAKIQDGSGVVTSGLGGIFPAGILIGYIKNIEKLGVELFQQADLQLAVDIRDIKNIFIIKDF
jgi:rod shape-determining protein MreC